MTDFIVFPGLEGDNVFEPQIRQAIANMPEMKLAFAPRSGSARYISESDVIALLASKLNLSEKGIANGLAGLDAEGKIPEGNIPGRLTQAGLIEKFVSQWEPRTFYPANTAVLNPLGQVVTNKSAHTSDEEYNQALWNLAPIDGGTP